MQVLVTVIAVTVVEKRMGRRLMLLWSAVSRTLLRSAVRSCCGQQCVVAVVYSNDAPLIHSAHNRKLVRNSKYYYSLAIIVSFTH